MKCNENIHKCIKIYYYTDIVYKLVQLHSANLSVNLVLIKNSSEYSILCWKQSNTDAQFYKIWIWQLNFWDAFFMTYQS